MLNTSIAGVRSISGSAKSYWFYAFSKPNDWIFYKKDIVNSSTDGRDRVEAGLKELENHGYLYRKPKRCELTGRLGGWEWFFFETPKSKEEIDEIVGIKKIVTEKRVSRSTVKRPLLSNKDILSNNPPLTPPKPKKSKPSKEEEEGQSPKEKITENNQTPKNPPKSKPIKEKNYSSREIPKLRDVVPPKVIRRKKHEVTERMLLASQKIAKKTEGMISERLALEILQSYGNTPEDSCDIALQAFLQICEENPNGFRNKNLHKPHLLLEKRVKTLIIHRDYNF